MKMKLISWPSGTRTSREQSSPLLYPHPAVPSYIKPICASIGCESPLQTSTGSPRCGHSPRRHASKSADGKAPASSSLSLPPDGGLLPSQSSSAAALHSASIARAVHDQPFPSACPQSPSSASSPCCALATWLPQPLNALLQASQPSARHSRTIGRSHASARHLTRKATSRTHTGPDALAHPVSSPVRCHTDASRGHIRHMYSAHVWESA